MEIKGNTEGVKKYCLNEIEALSGLPACGRAFASEELCLAMLAFSRKYHRELAVFLDARGRVIEAALGDFHTVQLSDFSDNARMRCIHTHPSGTPTLSEADITALKSGGFAAMACIAPNAEGGFGGGSVLLAGEERPLFFASLSRFCAFELPTAAKKNASSDDGEERALLISLSCGRKAESVRASLEELAELAQTAGVQVAGAYLQNADKPVAATYIGKGKAAELRMEAQLKNARILLFDDEISPTQLHNLESLTGLRIIDRTMLILDIFAARARSNEGKLQVELAQLRYMLPRLTGRGTQLSRLGGGIGTRGPGETKLETDRRKIRLRISELEARLAGVEKERDTQRAERTEKGVPSVALVGYTNAGKTTLLNAMSGEQSFSADLLFATLDTLTRRVTASGGQLYLLSDTVGFIRRLPHQLVAAFRATLNELRYADVLLHVLDVSSPEAEEQADAVESVLCELGLEDKPTVTVFNKCDKQEPDMLLHNRYPNAVHISAARRDGLEELETRIIEALTRERDYCRYKLLLPYAKASLLPLIHKSAEVYASVYGEEGISMELSSEKALKNKLLKQGAELLTEE